MIFASVTFCSSDGLKFKKQNKYYVLLYYWNNLINTLVSELAREWGIKLTWMSVLLINGQVAAWAERPQFLGVVSLSVLLGMIFFSRFQAFRYSRRDLKHRPNNERNKTKSNEEWRIRLKPLPHNYSYYSLGLRNRNLCSPVIETYIVTAVVSGRLPLRQQPQAYLGQLPRNYMFKVWKY